MTHADDHPDKLRADLKKWVRQNEDLGSGWFLDEGKPEEISEPITESTVGEIPEAVVARVEKARKPLAPEAKVTASNVAKESKPTTKPTTKPAPEITNPEFKQECERFVAQALATIAKQSPQVSAVAEFDQKNSDNPKETLLALRDEALSCQKCGLAKSRTQVVFGSGDAQARVLFIGEAPGREEDLQGEPFVGASGQLLTKIVEAIGFDRRHIYIANILKCRPPENRDPLLDEIEACSTFLKQQLGIIQPKIICCLGKVAAQTLLGSDLSLGRLREGIHFFEGIPVMATYHPAALLRNPAWKKDTWQDVQRLRALHDSLDDVVTNRSNAKGGS